MKNDPENTSYDVTLTGVTTATVTNFECVKMRSGKETKYFLVGLHNHEKKRRYQVACEYTYKTPFQYRVPKLFASVVI